MGNAVGQLWIVMISLDKATHPYAKQIDRLQLKFNKGHSSGDGFLSGQVGWANNRNELSLLRLVMVAEPTDQLAYLKNEHNKVIYDSTNGNWMMFYQDTHKIASLTRKLFSLENDMQHPLAKHSLTVAAVPVPSHTVITINTASQCSLHYKLHLAIY